MTSRSPVSRVRDSVTYRAWKFGWQTFAWAKQITQRLSSRRPVGHLFIFGCQRSGTTWLENLFRADPRPVVFGEFSPLSVTPAHTCWRPLPDVRAQLERVAAEFSVSRTLFESHRAAEILAAVDRSAAIWLYRDPAAVVASMQQKWGTTFRQISARVETVPGGAWALDTLWTDIVAEAETLSDSPAQQAADAYGLYWLRRNALILEQAVDRHPRIVVSDYADLVRDPGRVIARGLSLLGLPASHIRFPQAPRPTRARAAAASSGSADALALSPSVAARCDALYQQIRRATGADCR